mmetsp:Transcript_39037/g.54243  ORF Transcript_39037/g.54243 Transcript_39037/m.54243 type:complete len:567 (-) Transcript_39037:137-1837(-)
MLSSFANVQVSRVNPHCHSPFNSITSNSDYHRSCYKLRSHATYNSPFFSSTSSPEHQVLLRSAGSNNRNKGLGSVIQSLAKSFPCYVSIADFINSEDAQDISSTSTTLDITSPQTPPPPPLLTSLPYSSSSPNLAPHSLSSSPSSPTLSSLVPYSIHSADDTVENNISPAQSLKSSNLLGVLDEPQLYGDEAMEDEDQDHSTSDSSIEEQVQRQTTPSMQTLLSAQTSSRTSSASSPISPKFVSYTTNSFDGLHVMEIEESMYPYESTTAEVYEARVEDGFVPEFAHVRATLDYSYHFNPTLSRQRVQDAIIRDVLKSGVSTEEPWLVFTAGAMGAGKSWCIKRLSEKGYFNDSCFVIVDPDDMRRRLPEYQGYIKHDRSTAGDQTHQEASLMTEIALYEALRKQKHVLVDTSLRDWKWFQKYFATVREQYPARKIAIIHVEASREQVYKHAEKRAKKTGREVPKEKLDLAIEQVPLSVAKLAPLTDYTATIVNNEHTLEIMSGDVSWEGFRSRWEICGTLGMDPNECKTNTIIFPDDYEAPLHHPVHDRSEVCLIQKWPSEKNEK